MIITLDRKNARQLCQIISIHYFFKFVMYENLKDEAFFFRSERLSLKDNVFYECLNDYDDFKLHIDYPIISIFRKVILKTKINWIISRN